MIEHIINMPHTHILFVSHSLFAHDIFSKICECLFFHLLALLSTHLAHQRDDFNLVILGFFFSVIAKAFCTFCLSRTAKQPETWPRSGPARTTLRSLPFSTSGQRSFPRLHKPTLSIVLIDSFFTFVNHIILVSYVIRSLLKSQRATWPSSR